MRQRDVRVKEVGRIKLEEGNRVNEGKDVKKEKGEEAC